jgi:hypothetical protein
MQDLKRTTIIGGLAACLSDIRFSPKTDMTGETGMSAKGPRRDIAGLIDYFVDDAVERRCG